MSFLTSGYQLDDSYGYPLIKYSDSDGRMSWFYPQISENSQYPHSPKLVHGQPVKHFLTDYEVTTFQPSDGSPPIILRVIQK